MRPNSIVRFSGTREIPAGKPSWDWFGGRRFGLMSTRRKRKRPPRKRRVFSASNVKYMVVDECVENLLKRNFCGADELV